MIEKRKFHRLQLSTRSILNQQGEIHHGQLENISLNGALIHLEFGTYLQKGSEYDLTVYIDGEDLPLQFDVRVVSVTFAMAGIKFVGYEGDTEIRLAQLLIKLSAQPDKAKIVLENTGENYSNF